MIREVDADTFIELGFALRRGDPAWIPPIRAALRRELTLVRHGRLKLFAAGDAGRIAAIVNDRLPEGQLGYLEVADDAATFRELVAAGLEWLRAQGIGRVLAPINGGAHRAHRVMTAGFEREPFLLEPRNPEYQVSLWLGEGFFPVHRWASYELSDAGRLAPLFDGPAAAAEAAGYRLVVLDPSDVAGTLGRLHPILDRVWAGHVGYAPMDPDEFVEAYAGILAVLEPGDMGVVVDAAGRDVGVGLIYPDRAADVRALQGDGSRWGRWSGRPKRAILHTVAFVPEARGTGAASIFLREGLARVARLGYEEIVVALVTEEYTVFGKALEATREYALLGRPV